MDSAKMFWRQKIVNRDGAEPWKRKAEMGNRLKAGRGLVAPDDRPSLLSATG